MKTRHRSTFISPAVAAVAALVISAWTASATLVNPGFETGDFTGWTPELSGAGSATVVTSHLTESSSTYLPVQGSYFALVKTDGPGAQQVIYQGITMSPGDMLSGYAAFDYGDYHPFNDRAWVRIYSGATLVATPWEVQGNDVPNYSDGPWTEWSWIATTGGNYTLELGLFNNGDDIQDSYALFDANQFTPVPEPSTILAGALLILPFAVQLGRFARRHQKPVA